MKVLFLTNNEVSFPLRDWLSEVAGEKVITVGQRISPDLISQVNPDFTVSYNYRFLLSPAIIAQLGDRVVNLHTSYLPWNRGAAPNVWSFLKNTPKGVTIHEIDAGLDTGRILVQEELVFDEEAETLQSSFRTLHAAIQQLFQHNWGKIRCQQIVPQQQAGTGSSQTLADFKALKPILDPEGWEISIPVLKQRYAEKAGPKGSGAVLEVPVSTTSP